MIRKNLDDIAAHLRYIDEIAEGRSEYIEKHLAQVVLGHKMFSDVFESFAEGL